MLKIATIGLALALLVPTFASAELVSPSYTATARTIWEDFKTIATSRRLTPAEARGAEDVAALWVYLGPCEGRANLPGLPQDPSVFGTVARANPQDREGGAILLMIAVMTRENLGRKPHEHVCRFALETAQRPH